MSLYRKARDRTVAGILRKFFTYRFGDIGSLTSLRIDSKLRTMHLELKLRGEERPLQVRIGRYGLVEEAGKTFLEVREIETSRPWINAALSHFFAEGRIEVPSEYARLLRLAAL